MNIIQKNKMKLINKKYMKKNTKNTKNTKKKVGGADGPVKTAVEEYTKDIKDLQDVIQAITVDQIGAEEGKEYKTGENIDTLFQVIASSDKKMSNLLDQKIEKINNDIQKLTDATVKDELEKKMVDASDPNIVPIMKKFNDESKSTHIVNTIANTKAILTKVATGVTPPGSSPDPPDPPETLEQAQELIKTITDDMMEKLTEAAEALDTVFKDIETKITDAGGTGSPPPGGPPTSGGPTPPPGTGTIKGDDVKKSIDNLKTYISTIDANKITATDDEKIKEEISGLNLLGAFNKSLYTALGKLDQLEYSQIVNGKYKGSSKWPSKDQSEKLIKSLDTHVSSLPP